MQCPICHDVDLKIADRKGVEIDYCPRCRGVWLDRGELDKIIERSAEAMSAMTTARYRDDDDDDDDRRGIPYRDYAPKKKKRESFLSELFDF